jgi:hypothetical protein
MRSAYRAIVEKSEMNKASVKLGVDAKVKIK